MLEVEYFGRVRDIFGKDNDTLPLADGAQSLRDFAIFLGEHCVELGVALNPDWLRFAVNGVVVEPDVTLSQGDRVSVFLSVSGG